MYKKYIKLKDKTLKYGWAIYEYEFFNDNRDNEQFNLIKLIKCGPSVVWCKSGVFDKRRIDRDYYIKKYKTKSSMLKDNFDLLLQG